MLVEPTKIYVSANCIRSCRTWLGLVCFAGLLQTGCGDNRPLANEGSRPSMSARSGNESATKSVSPQTQSVLPDLQATETSPAAFNDADPRAVCRRFLELLQSNNRIAAENLLTQTALQVTGKAGLVLEPLSGPNSQYDIGAPQYATIKNEIAYVDCQISDLDDKTVSSFSVSWIVKKQNSGWRIAGLVMDMEGDQPRQKMFSFENPQDVAEIKLRAVELWVDNTQTSDSERQANLSNADKESTIK